MPAKSTLYCTRCSCVKWNIWYSWLGSTRQALPLWHKLFKRGRVSRVHQSVSTKTYRGLKGIINKQHWWFKKRDQTTDFSCNFRPAQTRRDACWKTEYLDITTFRENYTIFFKTRFWRWKTAHISVSYAVLYGLISWSLVHYL